MARKRDRERMWKGWEEAGYTARQSDAISTFIRTGKETDEYLRLVENPDPVLESPERMPNRPRPAS